MEVFLLEDDLNVRKIFTTHCAEKGIKLTAATSLGEALPIVEELDHRFDLAICDLKVPSSPGAVDENVQYGLAVLRNIISNWPGVPVIVLSAFGTVDVMADMILKARQLDIYGDKVVRPMLRFVQKAQLINALSVIDSVAGELYALDQIELPVPSLTEEYRRAVRIFARRKGGWLVEYKQLAGGRSGARTGLATVTDGSGAQVAHVVSKMTRLDRAAEEKLRYTSHISGKLGAATFADLSDEVMAGCGGSAGLFYSVADAFQRDLFSVLASDSPMAAAVVDALSENCAPWLTGAPHASKTWQEVRRNLIADANYEKVNSDFDIIEIPDDKAIQCIWTSQHGDLHGSNILVDNNSRPVLIDYGRAGKAPSVLDPLTLELSALLHPDSPFSDSDWPTRDDLEKWPDLESYVKNCPYSEFVRACRRWAASANVGQRDLYATVSAYCLRNLQYDDVNKARALSLQRLAGSLVNLA